jgi:tight adherence protein C
MNSIKKNKIKKKRFIFFNRNREAFYELPYFIDLLKIMVGAGIPFIHAIERVSSHYPGILSTEFLKAIKQIKMGVIQEQAFAEIKKNIPLLEVKNFINVITQSQKVGVSIVDILENQSEQIRYFYVEDIRRKINALSVKIIFIIALFLLPSLFIIALMTPFIHIYQSLFMIL